MPRKPAIPGARKPQKPKGPTPEEAEAAARVARAAALASLSRIEFARSMLAQVLVDVENARGKPGGLTAVQQGTRFAMSLRGEIEDLERDQGAGGNLRSITDDELLDRVCDQIVATDEAAFARILEACETRLGGRPVLRVVD